MFTELSLVFVQGLLREIGSEGGRLHYTECLSMEGWSACLEKLWIKSDCFQVWGNTQLSQILLPGPLWLDVVVPVSMGQIDLFWKLYSMELYAENSFTSACCTP